MLMGRTDPKTRLPLGLVALFFSYIKESIYELGLRLIILSCEKINCVQNQQIMK